MNPSWLVLSLAALLTLAEPRFVDGARDSSTGAPQRAEVFGVYPLRASDITDATAACREARCYRVEPYNHARGAATTAMVDAATGTVSAVIDYGPMFVPDGR